MKEYSPDPDDPFVQKYRESLPPERQRYWDAATGRPHVPLEKGNPWKPRHGLIIGGACAMGLYWFNECLAFLAHMIEALYTMQPPKMGGWFGLAFTAVIFGLVAWYCV